MKKGFTLIEVIVAIAAAALLILAISGLTGISLRMNRETSVSDEGFNIARSICEMYKSEDDMYSGTGDEIYVFKYINNLSDIHSVKGIIQNKDGDFYEGNYEDIITEGSDFKYTLILKIKKLEVIEDMEGLWIVIVRNDKKLVGFKMNTAK